MVKIARKKTPVASFDRLASLPGTKWVTFGDTNSDGKVVAVPVDAIDGHIIEAAEFNERIRLHNSKSEVDMMKVDLITRRTTIDCEINKAKKVVKKRFEELLDAIDESALTPEEFEMEKERCEKEMDQFYEEYWQTKIEPLIQEAKELEEMLTEIQDRQDGVEKEELVQLTEKVSVSDKCKDGG